jgi:ribosome maturation factor RimP
MTRHDPIAERVLRIAEPVAVAAGYDLVDVRFTMEPGGWVLRVYLDKSDGVTQVDLDDCERMSRELSAVLDVEDPIPHAYSLEVSSPGLDRPLRTIQHFRRQTGSEVKISMAVPVQVPAGERRNFKGILLAVEGDTEAEAVAVVQIDGHEEFRLRLRDIDQARVVPDWDAVLHGNKKQQQKN